MADSETASAPSRGGRVSNKKTRGASEAAVRLQKVSKRFGAKTAVDNVSLKIDVGVVYGLIGPNGAGKTTTFSMLAGYLSPSEGSVEVLGFSPRAVDQLRGRLGVLPQDAILPANDRVGEFLIHMARMQDIPGLKAEGAARAVLEEVDGKDWWAQRCGSLSHGMAKRVALAQAILGEPEVVLLDEPTAGLDPRVAYEVRQLIKSRRGRCTVVVSSHNLQELEEICDGAAILDHGRIVAAGSMAELTASSEEVRVTLGRGTALGPWMQKLRELQTLKHVDFDDERFELTASFERKTLDAESAIGQILWILLNHQVRISGVTKGRGLEQRVMALTEA